MALTLVASLASILVFHSNWTMFGMLWDLGVYERALQDVASQANPYRHDVEFPFVYHPMVLAALGTAQSAFSLRLLLPVAYVLVFAWVVKLWVQVSATPTLKAWERGIALLAAVAFGGGGVVSVMAGNVTMALHFAIGVALVLAYQNPSQLRLAMACLVMAACSLVKPYFLAYLLLVLALRPDLPTLLMTGVSAALFALVWWWGAQVQPEAYSAFMDTLQQQTLNKKDLGYSFLGMVAQVTPDRRVWLLVHGVCSAALLGWTWRVWWSAKEHPANKPLAFALLYIAVTLALPRMKHYDLFPAVTLLFLAWQARAPLTFQRAMPVALLACLVPWLVTYLGLHVPGPATKYAAWQALSLAAMLTLAFRASKPLPSHIKAL
jgi:hypothetical protein